MEIKMETEMAMEMEIQIEIEMKIEKCLKTICEPLDLTIPEISTEHFSSLSQYIVPLPHVASLCWTWRSMINMEHIYQRSSLSSSYFFLCASFRFNTGIMLFEKTF